jgi:hypothetical protein
LLIRELLMMGLQRLNDFYTYLWLREDGTPYYVGKGHGRRAYTSRAHTVKRPKDDIRIQLQYWPDETTAFAFERYLIDFWGRKDLNAGCLRNLTDGGDKPPSRKGVAWTIDEKTAIGLRSVEVHSRPEVRKRRSLSLRKSWENPETRNKHILSLKAALALPESRAKKSVIGKEVGARPDVIAKRSASMKKTLASPEKRLAMSIAAKAAAYRRYHGAE